MDVNQILDQILDQIHNDHPRFAMSVIDPRSRLVYFFDVRGLPAGTLKIKGISVDGFGRPNAVVDLNDFENKLEG